MTLCNYKKLGQCLWKRSSRALETQPPCKQQMWMIHSWKFSLGSYFVVSYMLWNNTNKEEIICFLLTVVVKYSLFMNTVFPTNSLQEHSRRNYVTITSEHEFEASPVLVIFFVQLDSLVPKEDVQVWSRMTCYWWRNWSYALVPHLTVTILSNSSPTDTVCLCISISANK